MQALLSVCDGGLSVCVGSCVCCKVCELVCGDKAQLCAYCVGLQFSGRVTNGTCAGMLIVCHMLV